MTVKIHSTKLITIKPAAAKHIKHYMEKNHAPGLFLHVKKSGCSGFKYNPQPATQNDLDNPENKIFTEGEACVVVTKEDLPKLAGIKIDYVTENLGWKLVYINPKAENLCGCGESFSLKQEQKSTKPEPAG